MLRSLKDMQGFTIRASDGELGSAKDFFFDDAKWTLRYLVVDTGTWLPGRQVLVSPMEIGRPDWDNELLPVGLTVRQVEQSPAIEQDLPVSRQHEEQLALYYGWLPYWGYVGNPVVAFPGKFGTRTTEAKTERDPHLRSFDEVLGYHIHAEDGRIGHVEDMIADTATWGIRYVVVDPRNWLPGKNVLIAPDWVEDVDWSRAEVHVNLAQETIRQSPAYDDSKPIDREYEQKLHNHYDRKGYWQDA